MRTLSRELKINPNTAHKIVTYLVNEGFLETRPGIGTMVARLPDSTGKKRASLLGQEIEMLVVEARQLGIEEEEVTEAVRGHWQWMDSAGEHNGHRNQSANEAKEGRRRQ